MDRPNNQYYFSPTWTPDPDTAAWLEEELELIRRSLNSDLTGTDMETAGLLFDLNGSQNRQGNQPPAHADFGQGEFVVPDAVDHSTAHDNEAWNDFNPMIPLCGAPEWNVNMLAPNHVPPTDEASVEGFVDLTGYNIAGRLSVPYSATNQQALSYTDMSPGTLSVNRVPSQPIHSTTPRHVRRIAIANPGGPRYSTTCMGDAGSCTPQATRKRKRPKDEERARALPMTHSKEEWDSKKEKIHEIYCINGSPMDVLVREMADLHNFRASDSAYQTRLREWGMKKNKKDDVGVGCRFCGMHPEERPRVRRQVVPKSNSGMFLSNAAIHSKIGSQKIQRGLQHLDELSMYRDMTYYSVNRFVDMLFSSGGETGRWRADPSNLIAPTDSFDDFEACQLLYDQCQGIHTLVKANRWILVAQTLDRVFRVETVAKKPGPYILIFIWKICLVLTRIRISGMDWADTISERWSHAEQSSLRCWAPIQRQHRRPLETDQPRKKPERRKNPRSRIRAPRSEGNSQQAELSDVSHPQNTERLRKRQTSLSNFALLGVFLNRLSRQLSTNFKGAHPMRELLHALCCVFVVMDEQPQFKCVLELGYRQTIYKFAGFVGLSHPVVKSMRSHYAKIWEELPVVEKTRNDEMRKVGNKHTEISELYERTWSLAKGKDDSDDALSSAVKLYTKTSSICANQRNLKWSLYTRALRFSADLVAKIHIKRFVRTRRGAHSPVVGPTRETLLDNEFSRVKSAVAILARGDKECLISAAHLSKTLALWYKGLGDRDTYDAQRKETSQIFMIISIDSERWSGKLVLGQGSQNNLWRQQLRAVKEWFILHLARELDKMKKHHSSIVPGPLSS